MKIYLLNDTSKTVHAGSDAVMRNLNAKLAEHEVIARHRVGEMHIHDDALNKADWVIVNGEGTIHHDQKVGVFLLECLRRAQSIGKNTALLNSIYQSMNARHSTTLQALDVFTVRDPFSHREASALGAEPKLMIDMCVDEDYIDAGNSIGKFDVCKGRAHRAARVKGFLRHKRTSRLLRTIPYPELPLTGRFEDVIATLKSARLYITGQYHGVYACGLAGTPFVCFPSNSHKMEALIDWSRLPIPICRNERDLDRQIKSAIHNRGMFREFNDFLRDQPRHTAPFFETCFGKMNTAHE